MQMGAGMPMHMGAVPLDQNDGSISQNLYNGRGNYRLLTIDFFLFSISHNFVENSTNNPGNLV